MNPRTRRVALYAIGAIAILASVNALAHSYAGLYEWAVHHRLADRVRAHIFICMLAYYVRWHLERAWAPLLFKDEDKPVADDVVAPARRSPAALAKARSQRLADGTEVHSFRSLLVELGTLTKNTMRLPNSEVTFEKLANPTPLQNRALHLLGLTASL